MTFSAIRARCGAYDEPDVLRAALQMAASFAAGRLTDDPFARVTFDKYLLLRRALDIPQGWQTVALARVTRMLCSTLPWSRQLRLFVGAPPTPNLQIYSLGWLQSRGQKVRLAVQKFLRIAFFGLALVVVGMVRAESAVRRGRADRGQGTGDRG
jgi:hypothetical protein